VQWADACVVVYSITDKQSFEYAVEALENFQKLRPISAVPVTLLANKADLEHLREVSSLLLSLGQSGRCVKLTIHLSSS
jgi:GTPase SAR1 family protein